MTGPTAVQKFTAEVFGTAILVFIGAGSVPLTVFLTGSQPFGSAELSTISFAFAFAIFAAVYSVGHISGAHINPAVTIALAATRKIDWRTASYYIAAQLVGATLGALLTFIILSGNDPVKLGLGAVTVNAKAGPIVGLLAEIIGDRGCDRRGIGALERLVDAALAVKQERQLKQIGHREATRRQTRQEISDVGNAGARKIELTLRRSHLSGRHYGNRKAIAGALREVGGPARQFFMNLMNRRKPMRDFQLDWRLRAQNRRCGEQRAARKHGPSGDGHDVLPVY